MFEEGVVAGGITRDVAAPAVGAGGAPRAASASEEALDRLASMAPGSQLADVVERLLGSVAGPEGVSGSATSGAQTAPEVPPPARLAGLGADALSELVAACGRLASWAAWAQGLMAAALARTPELSERPAPWGPGGRAPRAVTPEENRFTTSSEIACRLGVSRTRAQQLLETGQALSGPSLAPTGELHRAGELDAGKAAILVRRLEGVADSLATAVQAEVLPRAPRRTHAQFARDVDRALTRLDPDGRSERRRRDVAGRHVSRPRATGEGVHEMRLVLPTMDAFLLDATLDAVAASARAAGDERDLGPLRADALTAMALRTLGGAQHEATAPSTASRSSLSEPDDSGIAHDGAQRSLLHDGVPLEALLDSLSGLVSSTSPWWTPSGTAPVPLPDGLEVRVDVTVPLDHLVEALDASGDGGAPGDPGGPSAAGGRRRSGASGDPGRFGASSDPGDPKRHGATRHPGDPGDPRRPGDPRVPRTSGVGDTAPPPESWPRSTSRVQPPVATVTVGGRTAPVPVSVALALAAGGTWRRLVTDPLSGAVLDVGRRRYRPPAALAYLVRARDASCTHPGCDVPAHRCDLDHVTAWNQGGTTSLDNLTCLCETHHRLKHTPGWSLRRAADGALVWRTPSGERYRREPDGSVLRLARRVGPRQVLRNGGAVDELLARAVTDSVVARLERGLEQQRQRLDDKRARETSEERSATQERSAAEGRSVPRTPVHAPRVEALRLETRGPRPGERPGAWGTDVAVAGSPVAGTPVAGAPMAGWPPAEPQRAVSATAGTAAPQTAEAGAAALHELGLDALLDAVVPF